MKHLFFVFLILNESLLFSQDSDQKILFFAARGASIKPYSFTGHAFVSWGSLKGEDSIVRAPVTLGFFPADHNVDLFSFLLDDLASEVVPGFRPNSKKVTTYQMALVVDSVHWQAALDTAYAWAQKDYSLLHRNCVTFMDAVADAAGLETPNTKVLWMPRRPKQYLKKLLKINRLRTIVVPAVHYDQNMPAQEVISLH